MMIAYYAIMWDRMELNLYDLLLASSWWPNRFSRRRRLAYCAWAIELADRPTRR